VRTCLFLGYVRFVLAHLLCTAWTFTVVGMAQMATWAIKKHKAYKREFGREYPKGRKAMIPFVL